MRLKKVVLIGDCIRRSYQPTVQDELAAVAEVAGRYDVPIVDLHRATVEIGMERHMARNGLHFTPEGYVFLGKAVADVIRRELEVSEHRKASRSAFTGRSGTDFGGNNGALMSHFTAVCSRLSTPLRLRITDLNVASQPRSSQCLYDCPMSRRHLPLPHSPCLSSDNTATIRRRSGPV